MEKHRCLKQIPVRVGASFQRSARGLRSSTGENFERITAYHKSQKNDEEIRKRPRRGEWDHYTLCSCVSVVRTCKIQWRSSSRPCWRSSWTGQKCSPRCITLTAAASADKEHFWYCHLLFEIWTDSIDKLLKATSDNELFPCWMKHEVYVPLGEGTRAPCMWRWVRSPPASPRAANSEASGWTVAALLLANNR